MKYAEQYLKTAVKLLDDYDGSHPLHHYLKNKFAVEKKYGSKDRRHITHLCYSFFRLGHFLKLGNAEERIKTALFLSGNEEWKTIFPTETGTTSNLDVRTRMKLVEGKYQQHSSAIFPWQHELSNGIDKSDFTLSHLSQPCVFIRARPGKEPSVKAKLEKAAIPFSQVSDTCFAFNNNVQLETILELNKEYVVQDYNSQRVGEFMHMINENNLPLKVWDCCAASGGKAIMAYDILQNLRMTVSDVRPSIIHNLKARFAEAGLKNYSSFIADLTQPQSSIPDAPFDLVICDAPCSGSGTWSRTPEQLYYFHNDEIWRYSGVQKQIVSNVIRFIKPGGYLLYVTCSVFKKENEDVIDFIQKDFQCKLIKMELLKGYDKKADTMFAALFRL